MARARLSLCLEVSRAQPRGPLPGGALLAPWPWGACRPLTRPTLGSCCLAARLCPHRSPGRAGARGRGGRALQETAGRATTSACVCFRTQVSLRIELGMQSLTRPSFSIGVHEGGPDAVVSSSSDVPSVSVNLLTCGLLSGCLLLCFPIPSSRSLRGRGGALVTGLPVAEVCSFVWAAARCRFCPGFICRGFCRLVLFLARFSLI